MNVDLADGQILSCLGSDWTKKEGKNENKWLSREVSQHEHNQELPDERKGVRGE